MTRGPGCWGIDVGIASSFLLAMTGGGLRRKEAVIPVSPASRPHEAAALKLPHKSALKLPHKVEAATRDGLRVASEGRVRGC